MEKEREKEQEALRQAVQRGKEQFMPRLTAAETKFNELSKIAEHFCKSGKLGDETDILEEIRLLKLKEAKQENCY